jgi:hypothetical protein
LKKAFALLLLFTFLFNVGGYYIVFWGLRFQADQQLIKRLDADQYLPEETFEIKIPVTLPYPIQATDFQRVDGNFEHNGEVFKLVKQKLQNDTLYVVCIRNHQVEQLKITLTDYVELTNSLPGTNQKALNFLGKLVKDFCSQQDFNFLHDSSFTTTSRFAETSLSFCSPVMQILAPPPEV